jgi:hypothetical protein
MVIGKECEASNLWEGILVYEDDAVQMDPRDLEEHRSYFNPRSGWSLRSFFSNHHESQHKVCSRIPST